VAQNDWVNGQGPGATSIAAALRYHARPPSANDHELLNDFAGALGNPDTAFCTG
jgi:hypothetical protein